MVVKTILLARHGHRLSWETQTWTSPTGTPRDPPLASHGVNQAVELANWLASLPDKPQAIYSSPLYRCLQTATPTAKALGDMPIHVEHGISEWYLPAKRGFHPQSLPAERLSEWFPLITTAHSSILYPSRRGESGIEIHKRAEDVLRLLLEKWDKQEGLETVILFTHAATNIAMGRALTGDREKDIRSATCSVGKYVRIEGKERDRDGLGLWEMVLNGETGFLERGEERHWDFSYVEEYEEDGIMEDGTDAPLASDRYSTAPPGKL